MADQSRVNSCELPDKLSDLVDLALDDLEKVEKDPVYVVDMKVWHSLYPATEEGEPTPRGDVCHVCLAGAVMAKTCGFSPQVSLLPGGFGRMEELKFQFLDFFRTSPSFAVFFAAMEMGVKIPGGGPEIIQAYIDDEIRLERPPFYNDDPEEFKRVTRENAGRLRGMGF